MIMHEQRNGETMHRRQMPLVRFWVMAVGILLIGLPAACSAGSTGEPSKTPAEFQKGEAKFNANCARCHGEQAIGTAQGPPLVHKIYEPSHHGDAAFQLAAARGVRAHHWQFGDMPKVEGVTSDDVTQITAYVRWLQRQAGIQ
jgi:cytochrome c